MHHAEQEGVEFHWLTNPVAVLDDGKGGVRGMRCVRMELGEPDDSGRRRPVPVAGSEFDFEADLVVYAIGTNANPIMGQTSKLKLNKWGYIATDDNLATSVAGVFAGGDIVTGAATVIEAMGAGRKAARSMKAYLGIRDTRSAYAARPAARTRVRHRRQRAQFRARARGLSAAITDNHTWTQRPLNNTGSGEAGRSPQQAKRPARKSADAR